MHLLPHGHRFLTSSSPPRGALRLAVSALAALLVAPPPRAPWSRRPPRRRPTCSPTATSAPATPPAGPAHPATPSSPRRSTPGAPTRWPERRATATTRSAARSSASSRRRPTASPARWRATTSSSATPAPAPATPSNWTPAASSWTQLSTSFTTGSSTTSVTIYIHGWYAQPVFYADSLVLTGPAGSGGGGGGGTPAPAAPTNLAVTGTTSSSVSLSWTAPSGTVTGYLVYENGSQVSTVTATSATITGLAASTTLRLHRRRRTTPRARRRSPATVSATTAASGGGGGGGGGGLPAHVLMGYWQDFTNGATAAQARQRAGQLQPHRRGVRERDDHPGPGVLQPGLGAVLRPRRLHAGAVHQRHRHAALPRAEGGPLGRRAERHGIACPTPPARPTSPTASTR